MSSKLRLIKAFIYGAVVVCSVAIVQITQVYSVPFEFKVFVIPTLVGGISAVFIALYRIKTEALLQELEAKNISLKDLAAKDGLTGLFNRRSFDERIAVDWSHWNRNKTIFSLMLIDIDFFKPFNDTYGHIAGDDCLKQIAQLLQDTILRNEDFVARYGGEEFVVILPNANEDQALKKAHKIHSLFEKMAIKHSSSKCSEIVTTSIGIVSSNSFNDAKSVNDIISYADKALYYAKHNGRNQSSVF